MKEGNYVLQGDWRPALIITFFVGKHEEFLLPMVRNGPCSKRLFVEVILQLLTPSPLLHRPARSARGARAVPQSVPQS